MAQQPTRRALIGAMITVPVMALPIAAPAIASTTQWDAALANYRRLHKTHELVCDRFEEAENAYFDARPKGPASDGILRVGDSVEAYNARQRQQRADYAAADARASEESGYEAAKEAEYAAATAECDAFDVLLATPAPTLRAVALKLELAIKEGGNIDMVAPMVADLRRFAGEA